MFSSIALTPVFMFGVNIPNCLANLNGELNIYGVLLCSTGCLCQYPQPFTLSATHHVIQVALPTATANTPIVGVLCHGSQKTNHNRTVCTTNSANQNHSPSLVCALVICRSKSLFLPIRFCCTIAFFRSRTDMCSPSNVTVSYSKADLNL